MSAEYKGSATTDMTEISISARLRPENTDQAFVLAAELEKETSQYAFFARR
jgi:hypothetical protein